MTKPTQTNQSSPNPTSRSPTFINTHAIERDFDATPSSISWGSLAQTLGSSYGSSYGRNTAGQS
jgi:hypothetical protein